MKLTNTIQKAINLAAEKHLGQTRKGIVVPYVVHPFSVFVILSEYTNNEDILVAGLLHDVLEDVEGYYFKDMVKDFNKTVAEYVKQVSEDKDPNANEKDELPWEDRKKKYLENLNHDSDGALMVCCADKIHNLRSMMDAYEKEGDALWESFNAKLNRKFWFYGEVLKIAQERLKNDIVSELEVTYSKAKQTLL